MAVATDLFAEVGYHATSVRDITETVGMSKAGLYSSFASKEGILEEIYYSVIDGMLGELNEIVSSNVSLVEKLRRAIMVQIITTTGRVPELTIYHRERHHLSDITARRIAEKRRAYQKMLESIIRSGVASGDFLPVDVPVVTFGIVGMCAWTYQWFDPGGRLSAEEIGSLYADTIIRGLLCTQSVQKYSF